MALWRVLVCTVACVRVSVLAAPGKVAVRGTVAKARAYLDHSETDKELEALLEAFASDTRESAREPVPEPETVPYAPVVCRQKFAYKASRERCVKVQKRICGKDCTKILPEGSKLEPQCVDLQKSLCAIPEFKTPPKPVKLGDANNGTLTICHAYPTAAKIAVQHDKYFALKDPKPFLTGLRYLECKQVMVVPGEALNIYLDSHPIANHVVGAENAILMVGQMKLGEFKAGLTVYGFKKEGYQRPIVCNAYPEPKLNVAVGGRKWHPFAEAHHGKSIKYLECEKLSLDHADSQLDPEQLEFKVPDGKVAGYVNISPVHTLYVVGAKMPRGTPDELVFHEFHFDGLRQ